jgi:hypothetical protein
MAVPANPPGETTVMAAPTVDAPNGAANPSSSGISAGMLSHPTVSDIFGKIVP